MRRVRQDILCGILRAGCNRQWREKGIGGLTRSAGISCARSESAKLAVSPLADSLRRREDHQYILSRLTLPPLRTTATFFNPASDLNSSESTTATPTAPLGSTISFTRSQTKRIAERIWSSVTVKM